MPTPKPRSDLRAGIFILISLLLIVGVIVAIKGFSALFVPTDTRQVRFSLNDDLGGLRVGDDVRLGGFKVGVVRSISVAGIDNDSDAGGNGSGKPDIVVKFTMPKKYPLHENAMVGIQTSVTGTTVLNISGLGTGQVLGADEDLAGKPSALSSLLASLSGAGPQVQDILNRVRTETLPRINTAAGRAGETLASVKTAADSLGSLFGDTKPDFRGTIANLHAITGDVKDRAPALLDHADALVQKVSMQIDNARSAIEDVKAAIANAKAVSVSARSIVVGNRGRLDEIISSLRVTSENLKGASGEIRHSPWRLLYKPAPGEMENIALYDATRQFADGANAVSDASLALRDATEDPNADKARIQDLVDKLNDSFANFSSVEQKLWSSVKH